MLTQIAAELHSAFRSAWLPKARLPEIRNDKVTPIGDFKKGQTSCNAESEVAN